jgi:cysteine desulfurase/selenocysteine lyase
MANFKNDFPILHQKINGHPLVYLDSGNTSQKPQCVIDAGVNYYANNNSNVHRSVHELSERATKDFEATRELVRQALNAKSTHEIIFTSGTTAAINLVAQSYGRSHFKSGDEIILSMMEHHSNIVPWQMIAEEVGAVIKVIPLTHEGDLDLEAFAHLISPKTKMLAITHASNVLGTINPIKKMIELAHTHHVPVLVDGAQAFPHMSVDVQDLDCDFYTFSAHKVYGPTGVGVLYGKEALLEKMPPYQGGGSMIETVHFEKTTFAKLPLKFEAGTPNIAGVVMLGAALNYVNQIGMQVIQQHEKQLTEHATRKLAEIDRLSILGKPKEKLGVIAFTFDHIHPHDIATILNYSGIAIRAGHHCAMPLMKFLGIPACARISFGIYNEISDIEKLVEGLQEVKTIMEVSRVATT